MLKIYIGHLCVLTLWSFFSMGGEAFESWKHVTVALVLPVFLSFLTFGSHWAFLL